MQNYLKIFISCHLLVVILGKSSVPVLMWNTHQEATNIPAVSALQLIQYSVFEGNYLESFNPKNIILFLQDAFSIEDLSNNAEQYENAASWASSSTHSLYLPAVETPHLLQTELPAKGYNVINIEAGSSLGGIELDKNGKNLVVVKLPSTITNPSRKKALQKTDEVMENVISKIGKIAEFTCVYTGIKPSVEGESIDHIRIARSLKQDPSNPVGFHKSNCVLLYFRNPMNLVKTDPDTGAITSNCTVSETDSEDVTAVGDCQPTSSSVKILYQNVCSFSKLHISFNFVKYYNRWDIVNASAYSVGSEVNTQYLYPVKDLTPIPLHMSFSCSKLLRFSANQTFNGEIWHLVLDGVQVQAFSNYSKFSNAWDCVGFFTIPIWAGLLSGLLLVGILFFGLYMLSDIKTMDRFDDPKGKHLLAYGSSD